jgi:hypothetical protein
MAMYKLLHKVQPTAAIIHRRHAGTQARARDSASEIRAGQLPSVTDRVPGKTLLGHV